MVQEALLSTAVPQVSMPCSPRSGSLAVTYDTREALPSRNRCFVQYCFI